MIFGKISCFGFVLFAIILMACGQGFAEPMVSKPYALEVFPREDKVVTDPETGTKLLFLTNAVAKDTNLYFHQRSWLADSSLILFNSAREKGGLMGYLTATGELVRLVASDGAGLMDPTAAVNRNSVFAMCGQRCVEIALTIQVSEDPTKEPSKVTAVERTLCEVAGVDTYLNESCDGRYLVASGANILNEGRPGLALIRELDGMCERLCDMPEGIEYHGHVQWSTTNPNWVSFAGAPVRLWMVDIRDRKPWSPYLEQQGELVTHESWWVNDQMLFCGGVHSKPTEDSHVKVLDPRTGQVRIIGEGAWFPQADSQTLARRNWWHASGSPNGLWVAGDNWFGDIWIFEGPTARPRILTMNHRTYGKGEHPEVGWDRRGEQVLFNSHKLGGVTVCVATIPESWQQDVRNIGRRLEQAPK